MMPGAEGPGARIVIDLRSRRLIAGTGLTGAVPHDPMRGTAERRSAVINAGGLGQSPEVTAARLDALAERYYPTLLVWPIAGGRAFRSHHSTIREGRQAAGATFRGDESHRFVAQRDRYDGIGWIPP